MVDNFVNASQEAALIQVDPSVIHHARRRPDHPANSADAIRATRGGVILAPRDAVLTWWKTNRRLVRGRPKLPTEPPGWPSDRWMWRALLAAAAGRDTYPRARPRLARLGYVDEHGHVTDTGRAMLAAAGITTDTTKERQ